MTAAAGAGGSAVVPTTVEEVVRHRLDSALGGWRGMAESAAPALAFLLAWLWREDLRTAITAAVAVLVVAVVIRLARRETVQHALGGIVAIAIAAAIAARTGRTEDYFLTGILYNAGLAVVFAASMLARWPVLGFLVGSVAGEVTAWRRDPGVVRLCQRVTGVFLAMYLLRVVVQLPLLLAGYTTALAVSKLVLGWPLLVAGVAVIAAILLRGHTPLTDVSALGEDRPEDGPPTGAAAPTRAEP
ncbi:uncharacterized protein DUF3159 [Kineococcus xinjiangensis]|uniref:Uncharacterized protein DUF3159 n=1 Tax=Kineococcus xinjiangensis TaxID=512762 RepID=A0A2S6IVM5_9ACTN|nr:DUF3159 domain-containing protein [Kineococcus xinjiangensis]PPK98373.1 uncharacterized protein DUF3159 [Kineococcus xinjiangensis]